MTIGLKRKLEDEPSLAAKKRADGLDQLDQLPACFSKSEYPIEFSPPREEDNSLVPAGLDTSTDAITAAAVEGVITTTTLVDESANMLSISATQIETASADMVELTAACSIQMNHHVAASSNETQSNMEVSPLRGDSSLEVSCSNNTFVEGGVQQVPVQVNKRSVDDGDDSRLKRQCMPRESCPPSSLEEPLIMPPESQDDNKENLVCLKTLTENQNFESILQKTLLATRSTSDNSCGAVGGKNDGTNNAKVIVEHLPSSVYDLDAHHHNALDDVAGLDGIDDEESSDDESSMFDTPPPKTAYDRFWTASSSGMSGTTNTAPLVSTYQFLEQNNQRIECDENGKSYLQLGTVNHHHLPVTPVLQPKPTTLTPRRSPQFHQPQSICRPSTLPPRPPNPTPPVMCEHQSMGLGASLLPGRCCSTACYRQQRSDMLGLSLHKLHTARQRSDSSLRRSVLICNMLRYIELESTTEQRQQAECIGYSSQQEPIVGLDHQSPYWNSAPVVPNFSPPPTPNPYRDNNGYNVSNNGSNNTSNNSSCENFDAPLKDFNSAFRQSSTPLVSSPAIPSTGCVSSVAMSSGVANSQVAVSHHDIATTSHQHNMHHNNTHHSSNHITTFSTTPSSMCSSSISTVTNISSTNNTSTSLDDDGSRGINWSSVLSLTSQTELDPLNNNSCYSDSSSLGSWTSSGGGAASLSDLDLSQTSFEDVSSWKVSAGGLPQSTNDDLMKTFPEENLFECAA